MSQYLLPENYDPFLSVEDIQKDPQQAFKKYQKLIDAIPHWIWETDQNLKITFSNSRVVDIVGYQANEILKIPINDLLFTAEFNGIDADAIFTYLAEGKELQSVIHHRIYHRDGGIRYLKTVITSNFNGTDEIIGFIGITEDQTSQILVEKALRESEKNLQLVLANLTEVVYMVDSNGTLAFISPAVEKLFGLKPADILQKPLIEVFTEMNLPPSAKSSIIRRFKRATNKQQQEVNFEIEMQTNGCRRIFDISEKILYDSSNNFKGITGTIQDITQRRKAEANVLAAFHGTIDAIAEIVEQRDLYTAGHQQNVARLSVAIAQELGLESNRIEGLRIAAMLHDTGKVSIPTEILTRPGKLSEPERRIVEMHPILGANILRQVPFPWNIARFVEEHHERMDGSGYPKGLKDEQIAIEARIIGAADTMDSLLNHRPYKPALDITEAIKIMKDLQGTKFDRDVVNAILRLLENNYFDSYVQKNDQLIIQ